MYMVWKIVQNIILRCRHKEKKYIFTQYIEVDDLGSKSRSMYYAQKKEVPFYYYLNWSQTGQRREMCICAIHSILGTSWTSQLLLY